MNVIMHGVWASLHDFEQGRCNEEFVLVYSKPR